MHTKDIRDLDFSKAAQSAHSENLTKALVETVKENPNNVNEVVDAINTAIRLGDDTLAQQLTEDYELLLYAKAWAAMNNQNLDTLSFDEQTKILNRVKSLCNLQAVNDPNPADLIVLIGKHNRRMSKLDLPQKLVESLLSKLNNPKPLSKFDTWEAASCNSSYTELFTYPAGMYKTNMQRSGMFDDAAVLTQWWAKPVGNIDDSAICTLEVGYNRVTEERLSALLKEKRPILKYLQRNDWFRVRLNWQQIPCGDDKAKLIVYLEGYTENSCR